MRKLLAIRECDVGWSREIVELAPHYYTVANDDGTLTTDFRTHDKYAKRLYYKLKPLWYLLHGWDMLVANPLVPAMNAGFDTLTVYPEAFPATTCGDFFISIDGFSDDWAILRERTSTNVVLDNANNYAFTIGNDTVTSKWYELVRGVLSFNTRSVGGNTVNSAVLSLAASGAVVDSLSITPGLVITTATPSNVVTPTGMAFADYGTTSVSGSAVTYATLSAVAGGEYLDISLSTSAINTMGVTTLATRSDYDVNNTAPTWSAPGGIRVRSGWGIVYADNAGTADDPRLVVTYTSNMIQRPRPNKPNLFAPGNPR